MKANWKYLATALAALALVAVAGCASGDIDDPGSPHNALQVDVTQSPPVTGTEDSATGACVFKITEWEIQFKNVPKNSLATASPYNDFFVDYIIVNYDWPGAAVVVPPQRELPAPGTVSPDETATIKFEPILLQDFDPNMEGTTGLLDMSVVATYSDGTRITVPLREALVVDSCQ
jgi:hypothetical protein